MKIDHRYMLHSNWRFVRPVQRECRDYEPPPRKGDWIVWLGCIALLGLYVAFAR